jgi:hypothetical protein
MPRVGFEPTIPMFERAKTVHALDRAFTVIGYFKLMARRTLFCMRRTRFSPRAKITVAVVLGIVDPVHLSL